MTVVTGTSPHGQGHATTWAHARQRTSSASRWTSIDGHPRRHRPRPDGRRHRRLAVAADRRVGRVTRRARLRRRRPRRGRRPARGERRRRRARQRVVACFHVAGVPSVRRAGPRSRPPAASRRADRRRHLATSRRRAPRFPFGAHIAVVEVDTETGAGPPRAASSRSTTPARSSTRCSSTARSTAGIARARRRRSTRDASTTTTATRMTRTFADYGDRLGRRAAELRAGRAWRPRRRSTRSAPRASASRAPSGRRRPCRTR